MKITVDQAASSNFNEWINMMNGFRSLHSKQDGWNLPNRCFDRKWFLTVLNGSTNLNYQVSRPLHIRTDSTSVLSLMKR